ncbi:hypothetical protein XYCOK13_18530 [Xylanibacillus composti]|uniref:Apea-like HEPN domain-containing protein n=1 Tax=Xylanibacillus composti TaxID=1572762 RepID=A0A8J4H191_9BACL|nr:hypothetical protein XYCOK13_18530 [Xylanibacillus composti]
MYLNFSDKIPKMNVDEDIDIIRQTRNKVAHCKELDKVEYREIMKLLNKLIKDIDKAILLTEERDFVHKNQEYLKNTLSKISDTMKIFTKDFQDTISALLKSFQLSIKEMQKPFDNLRLGLMLNSNPFFFEKGNNDQEDN